MDELNEKPEILNLEISPGDMAFIHHCVDNPRLPNEAAILAARRYKERIHSLHRQCEKSEHQWKDFGLAKTGNKISKCENCEIYMVVGGIVEND